MGSVNNADISDNRIDFIRSFINGLTQEQTNSEGTLILQILDTTNDQNLIDSFNITNFKKFQYSFRQI